MYHVKFKLILHPLFVSAGCFVCPQLEKGCASTRKIVHMRYLVVSKRFLASGGHLDVSKRCETIGLPLDSLAGGEDQSVEIRSGRVRCSLFRVVDGGLTHRHVSRTMEVKCMAGWQLSTSCCTSKHCCRMRLHSHTPFMTCYSRWTHCYYSRIFHVVSAFLR